MEKSKKLEDFEKEYFSEIKSFEVTEDDLISVKIPKRILAYEVYLRKNFGDKLAKLNDVDDYDVNQKRKIEKVSAEKLDNSELNSIISDIDNSEFDNELDSFLHSNKESE